jgi:AcrR family transcriptional regulator
MRKLDPVKFEAKRREILTAAGRCFHRSGLNGASISDICKEAKISPGHLYYYFKDKSAIITALADLRLEEIADHFEKALSDESPLMNALLDEMARSAPEEGGALTAFLFEMFAEASRSPDMASILQGHSQKVHALLAEVLRRGQARGEIDARLDPETVAAMLIGVTDGLRGVWLRYPKTDSAKAVSLFALLLQRFLSPAAGDSNRLPMDS